MGGRRRAWSTGLIYIGVSLHSARINTAPTEKAGELQKQTRWCLGSFFSSLCFREGPVILQLLLITSAVWEQEKNPYHEGGGVGKGLQAWGRGTSVDSKAKQLKSKIRGGCETVFALGHSQ